MVRAGLGDGWQCIFANDIDDKKCESYLANWRDEVLRVGDVRALVCSDLPIGADLAWASFPCQDLSQAGAGAGLMGDRSGVFWPFWELLHSLARNDRPRLVVLENVPGAITSHGGRDFQAICSAFAGNGYKFGAVLLDAAQFVPQSRTRLFFIAARAEAPLSPELHSFRPSSSLHSKSLVAAVKNLPANVHENWLWWSMPNPPLRTKKFSDVLNADDGSLAWHSVSETARLLELMSPLHLQKIAQARAAGSPVVGAIYKRRRCDGQGGRVQRAEVRFDDLAGCLRTPAGGSSRQTIIVVDGDSIRTRILQPREAARLMGLDDEYILPSNYYEAYHLVGDGVVVPVVRYLARYLLEPLLDAKSTRQPDAGRRPLPASSNAQADASFSQSLRGFAGKHARFSGTRGDEDRPPKRVTVPA
ncbi:DNA cytosine methyltransferase [Antarcticirhabdus aurantiaca]|uniref:DNA cytosine methyltransferase n=1 Tax=Antarcticirhabdus aurantiaca TaxID=2606717 RepID=UPI003BB50048